MTRNMDTGEVYLSAIAYQSSLPCRKHYYQYTVTALYCSLISRQTPQIISDSHILADIGT